MSMGRLILWGPQPQAHVTALLQLSPDCGTAVPATVITPSSQALASLWSSRGPPHSSGRSPRAISVLGSQFPWGMCPHPPLPLRSLHPLPNMMMLMPTSKASALFLGCHVLLNVRGSWGPRHSKKPCPAMRRLQLPELLPEACPFLPCPDYVSLGLGQKERSVSEATTELIH